MDFFRHWYFDQADWDNNLYSDLNNMGFSYYDNESLLTLPHREGYYSENRMKWKYEPSTTSEGFVNAYAPGAGYGLLDCSENPNLAYISSSPVIIFIPLKNKGFFYKAQHQNSSTLVQPFLKYNLPQDVYSTDNCNRGWSAWIGFQSNVSNLTPYSYIFLASYAGWQYKDDINEILYYENVSSFPKTSRHTGHSYNPGFTDNHFIWVDGYCYPINFIDGANAYKTQEIEEDHGYWEPLLSVDINQNVCTLMHVPYNNTYLDNLYLLVTAPQVDMDSKFFSFSGRNFLNVAGNLVLELPAN